MQQPLFFNGIGHPLLCPGPPSRKNVHLAGCLRGNKLGMENRREKRSMAQADRRGRKKIWDGDYCREDLESVVGLSFTLVCPRECAASQTANLTKG